MPGFDIDSLLRFTPPEFLCERCCALLTNVSPALNGANHAAHPPAPLRCTVCGVAYVPTEEHPNPGVYLASRGFALHFGDIIAHSRELARIANALRSTMSGGSNDYPPMRALLEALTGAKQFIHFTTFGMSALLLGALKLAAQRVDVRCIVSGLKHESMFRELNDFQDEAPRLQARIFHNEGQFFPHQKLIVIDGLLAFKGSANMTDFGWRKAAQGREVIEIVTDVNEVIDLHNRYFAPVWVSFEGTHSPNTIVMSQD
jgi:phosphatidylserine/phosphatidylglycerophosphate/cardiolipin synthase-like enzyme